MTSGQLQLRGADPFDLESPTTLSGTNTDGQLTDVTLATPSVTTTRPVPEYNTTVTITAAFSMVEPGTGSINDDGSMTVRARLGVDLHLVVPLLSTPSDCRAAPIDLTLTSTAPYDPDAGRVTLRAPNFTVPPVTASSTCEQVLVGPVNDALAGSGHALALTLTGDITPPAAGQPTATALAVTPEGGAHVGTDVTLTATVAPEPAVPGAPAIAGVVAFYDGATQVGTADVGEDGTAVLVTSDLVAGSRQLRAAYGGAPPDWKPSESSAVAYTVTADPAVVTTAAGEVTVGGPGKDFNVTVVNTGFGAELADASLEVEIRRQVGTATIAPVGGNPRIALSHVAGGSATPVALTHSGSGANQRLAGTVGDLGAWLVAPGQERVEALRLEVAAGNAVGPLTVTFTLVTGEGEARTVLAAVTGVVTMVNEARTETTVVAGFTSPIPSVIPSIPPVTPVVRQGNVAQVSSLGVTPVVSAGVYPTGTFTFAIDGVPVLGQHVGLDGTPDPFTWLERVPKTGSNAHYLVKVPATTPIGARQVTVRYSGDALNAPSQANFPITVEPSTGTIYECVGQGAGAVQTRFTVNVEVQATLPTVWAAGQDLPVDRVQVRLRLSRTSFHAYLGGVGAEEPNLQLDLGPEGLITPATVTESNNTEMGVDDPNPPDHIVDLGGGTGTISVRPTPGDVVSYTLDRVVVTAVSTSGEGLVLGFICAPDGAPYTVGTVTSAGTALTANPAGPIGAGRAVTLTATALPAAPGVVEFRDGPTTIGVVPVDGSGVATMSTTALPAGTRSLTARFFGGVGVSTPSSPVELRVIGECPGFLDAGNGAVVRLVYLELLGRCPDAAGYAFWTGRLDGGTSPEVFARSIARTSEAVGRVVDDAYRTMLGRPADAAGRVFWTERLLGHGRYDQLLADLAGSSEFWSLAGSSNQGFVTRVYGQLLGRAPEAEGLDYWTGRLAAGASPRALVLSLANLDEPLGVLVRGSYGAILDRAPDAGERTAGIAHLRSTGDRSGLYAQLIGQPEFDQRAQGFPEV